MMTQARFETWEKISETLRPRQRDVLNAMIDLGGRATMHDVSDKLLVPLNAISGRFSELEKLGILAESDMERIKGRRPRTIYAISRWTV